MRKRLQTDEITNELEASAFFAHKKPQTEVVKRKPENSPPSHNEEVHEKNVSTPVRTNARTPVRRVITRYAFEFYQDQIENLRKMSLEEKQRGEKGSMSEMVRKAVDMYLSKKRPNE